MCKYLICKREKLDFFCTYNPGMKVKHINTRQQTRMKFNRQTNTFEYSFCHFQCHSFRAPFVSSVALFCVDQNANGKCDLTSPAFLFRFRVYYMTTWQNIETEPLLFLYRVCARRGEACVAYGIKEFVSLWLWCM